MSKLREFYFDDLEKQSDKWESYFDVYDHYVNTALQETLGKMPPERPITFVEVGVQNGGSLEMWGKFFHDESQWGGYPPVKIIGIDVDPDCSKLEYKNFPNIEVVIGDQGNPEFWDDFLTKHPKIDIFIDDGGHFCDAQILTFEKVFPKMPVGSVYICEDVHSSYMPYNKGGLRYKNSFIEYAKTYIDVIHQDWWNELDTTMEKRKSIGKDLTSIHFFDSIIVFEKFGKKKMQRVFPKKFGEVNV